MSIPSCHELVHVLSSVVRNREQAPTQSWVSSQENKHLRLLDGIALLLVIQDKGDVAAVSLVQTLSCIEFYYSKNIPCTPDMTEYIESMLDIIKKYEPSQRHIWIGQIVRTAAAKCLKKIRNRIKKISIELSNAGVKLSNDEICIDDIGLWRSTGAPEGMISQAFKKTYLLESAENFESPDKKLLVKSFRFSLIMNTSLEKLRSNFDGVVELLSLSHYIGHALSKDPIVSSTTLIRRIQIYERCEGNYEGPGSSNCIRP